VGCAAGYSVGYTAHLIIFNPLESFYSTTSLTLTMWSDYLTGDLKLNSWNWNEWEVGEDTTTGFWTWLGGTVATEPFIDAGFDIYASGHNHGYFCGMSTILDCFP
jgi:hypothetical protein